MKSILKNKYLTFFIVIFLFFVGSAFQLIPIKLLNIQNPTFNERIYLTMFSDFIIFIILIFLYKDSLKKDYEVFKKKNKEILYEGLKIWVFGLVLMATFNIIINQITPNNIAKNEQSLRFMIKINPFIMIINTSLLAPWIEELVFRKTFRIIFKNKIAFILISGIIFGGLHVIVSSTSLYDYLYLLPYCSLGIAFSYMYYKTDNIFSSISFHMIHNLIITSLNILLMGVILC